MDETNSAPDCPPGTNSDRPCSVPKVVSSNIVTLVRSRERVNTRRGWSSRLAEKSTRYAGTMKFLWLHLAFFAAWVILNSRYGLPKPFDPYPYEFMTFIVSLDAIVLAILVLIAQNELQEDSDRRAELDLQINLLSENEITLMLKKLARIEAKLGIEVSEDEAEDARELLQGTNPLDIIEELERSREVPEQKDSEKKNAAPLKP